MDFESSLPAPASIDAIRTKLQHLTTSLQALQSRLAGGTTHGQILPPWSSIGSALGVTLSQLATLTATLARAEEEARGLVVFPNGKFPVAQAEGLLATLMRTRPVPESETWLAQMKARGEGLEAVEPFKWSINPENDEMTREDEEGAGEEYTLVEWLAMQRDKRQWTGFYTKREIDDAFEIDRDDLDDIRRARQQETETAMVNARAMLRFARSGR